MRALIRFRHKGKNIYFIVLMSSRHLRNPNVEVIAKGSETLCINEMKHHKAEI